jgi:hypothetical protein
VFDFLKTAFSIIDKLINKSNMIGIDQTRKIGITIPELINNIYLCSFPLQLKCLNLIAINGISAISRIGNNKQTEATT